MKVILEAHIIKSLSHTHNLSVCLSVSLSLSKSYDFMLSHIHSCPWLHVGLGLATSTCRARCSRDSFIRHHSQQPRFPKPISPLFLPMLTPCLPNAAEHRDHNGLTCESLGGIWRWLFPRVLFHWLLSQLLTGVRQSLYSIPTPPGR